MNDTNTDETDEIDEALLPLDGRVKKPSMLPPDKRRYRNDTKSSSRQRKATATGTKEVEELVTKMGLLSTEPCPNNIVGVICAYMKADLYNLIPVDTVLRGKAFLDLLYKKADVSLFQFTNNNSGGFSDDKPAPPSSLHTTPYKEIGSNDEKKKENSD